MKNFKDHWVFVKANYGWLSIIFACFLALGTFTYFSIERSNIRRDAGIKRINKQQVIRGLFKSIDSSYSICFELLGENFNIIAEALIRTPLDTIGWDTVGWNFAMGCEFETIHIINDTLFQFDTVEVFDPNIKKFGIGMFISTHMLDCYFTAQQITYIGTVEEWRPKLEPKTKPKQLYYFTDDEYLKIKELVE